MLEINEISYWWHVTDSDVIVAIFRSKEDAELFVKAKFSDSPVCNTDTTGQWPCGCPVEPLITHMENTSSPYIENSVPLGWIGNGSPYFELNGPVDENEISVHFTGAVLQSAGDWYKSTFGCGPEPDGLPEVSFGCSAETAKFFDTREEAVAFVKSRLGTGRIDLLGPDDLPEPDAIVDTGGES